MIVCGDGMMKKREREGGGGWQKDACKAKCVNIFPIGMLSLGGININYYEMSVPHNNLSNFFFILSITFAVPLFSSYHFNISLSRLFQQQQQKKKRRFINNNA